MIVVSDTSPILNLARIGQLELLHALYLKVVIPPAVNREFEASLAGAGPINVKDWSSWLTIVEPINKSRVDELRMDLDAGESEAIVLALQLNAELLLVDEKKARAVAASLELRTVGLLGVLVEAKKAGLIRKVKPLLDDLISQARFWIGEALYRKVLSAVDEL